MEQKRTLSKWISARRYIREFAADYAERYAEDPAEIERDIIAAKKQNHISLNEYEWVGYHERTEAQKRTMSTLWTRAEFRKTYTDRRYIAILMNKYIFSKVFADFYGRRCVQASDVDAALLESLAGDCGKVVYKPNCKGQGTGVRILPAVTEAEQADTLAYLRANPGGIVEEYIQQHPTLAQLNPGAVSIVRFYTVTAPSGTYLFAPVLTTAIEKDISNGCQDALTAMIDIRTGVVITDAVDQNNCIDYHAHPVTGVSFPALVVLFVSVVCALLNMVLEAGVSLYHLGIRRGEEMPYVTLFDGFSFAGKIILLSIVQYIFVFLWTLLFIVPGIVAAYRYRFAILNLCENPEIGVMEAINMSKAQTAGFKWQLFVLDLSFIGWALLASLTLGILNIWLLPYIAQSNIAFFQEIKKAKGIGFFPPRPEDDGQFHPHDPFGEDNW